MSNWNEQESKALHETIMEHKEDNSTESIFDESWERECPAYEISNNVSPVSDKVIICLESAAVYLGLCNGMYFQKYPVYSAENIESAGLDVIVLPDCFESKQHIVRNDMYITTEEQTILDMLEYYDRIDIQALIEALSGYYFTHNETFGSIPEMLNEQQAVVFDRWKQDAIEYYSY